MVNRNFKQRMRQTLYRLKRDYGSGPVAIYTLNSATTNVQSGVTAVDKEVTILPRVIVLPATLSREVLQSISHISANKMFSYGGSTDTRTRMFIIDQEDAPALNLKIDSWLVFRGKKYSIKSVNDYDFRSGWVVVAQELVGVVPEQVHLQRAETLFSLASQCATHITTPVRSALSELKLYSVAENDASYRAASVVDLVHAAECIYDANGEQATSLLEITMEATASMAFSAAGADVAALASQASTLGVFTRATQVELTVGDVAYGTTSSTYTAQSDLVVNDTANAVMAFPANATDTIILESTANAVPAYLAAATNTISIESIGSAMAAFLAAGSDTITFGSVGAAGSDATSILGALDVVAVGTKDVTLSVLSELTETTIASTTHVTARDASDTITVTSTAGATVTTPGFPGAWAFRMPITIEADYIDADLTDWTYVFDELQAAALTAENGPLDADGSRPMVNGGGDIRFSSDSAGATRLPIDVRRCVVTNTAGDRKLEIAVKIPAVSASVDTTIYMWWGKAGETQPAVTDTYGQYAAYDSNYQMVQPLSEVADGTLWEYRCRTSNQYHAYGVGQIPDRSTTSKIGYSQYFDGASYIQTSYVAGTTWTWEFPFRLSGTPSTFYAMIAAPYTQAQILALSSARHFSVWNELHSGQAFNITSLALTTWHHIAFTRAGNSVTNGYKAYFNGSYTGQGNTGTWANANGVSVGGRPDTSQNCFAHFDEIRTSNIVRSAAWIKANWGNILQPNLFSACGAIVDL